jgi:DNA-binding MarR family transcriptional regulator
MSVIASDTCAALTNGEATADGIAAALGATRADVLPMLRACERDGLVSSARRPDGNRVFDLLPAGAEELEREEQLDTLLDSLTESPAINIQQSAYEIEDGLEAAEIVVRRGVTRGYLETNSAGSISMTDRGRRKLKHDIDRGRYPLARW